MLEINKETLTEIAIATINAIMNFEKQELTVSNTEDFSPVTEADLKANEIITERLTELYLEIPIVSEESENGAVANWFFLVGPLDAIKEFIKGLPDFTVNIALIKNGKPVKGVVYLPMTGESYYGDKQGAVKTATSRITSLMEMTSALVRTVTSASQKPIEQKTLEGLQKQQQ